MVEALGIKDGKVVATGALKDVREALPGADVQVLTGEQTLLPGLIDPHVHILPTTLFDSWGLDLSPFRGQDLIGEKYTISSVVEKLTVRFDELRDAENIKVAEANNDAGPTPWVGGSNLDPSLLYGDKEFNMSVFEDNGLNDYPALVMNTSVHIAYVNNLAFDVCIEFYASKGKDVLVEEIESWRKQDGLLFELEQIVPFVSAMPIAQSKDMVEAVKNIFLTASSRGLTYIFDAGVEPADSDAPNSFNQPNYLKALGHSAGCPVRIGAALVARDEENYTKLIQNNDEYNRVYEEKEGDDLFNFAFLKIISDGSNQGLSGALHEEYCCDDNYELTEHSDNTGILNYNPLGTYVDFVSMAMKDGWPLMIHANGDQAIDNTIFAYRHAYQMENCCDSDHTTYYGRRNRIEHASLLADQNFHDMKELGLSPSFLTGHIGYWGWMFKSTIFGQERSNDLDRCRSALDIGMRISFHSDNSVTPFGPLRMMEQSITRIMEGAPKDETPYPQVLNYAEHLNSFEALKAVTYDAAWQCHADQWVGSLEVDKCADFVILEKSPLGLEGQDAIGMRDIPVLETWKGGCRVYLNPKSSEASDKTNVLESILNTEHPN
ncbi:MAG: amidohydrolase family protein [Magnetovibrio sp.]|nr:amidohydrolase family protein [Magnetovibrio sp.]